MPTNNLPKSQVARPSETDYFDTYYNTQAPVSGPQYDAVYTFFLTRTNNNKEAARSLTTSLLEVTYSTGIDPMLVLDDFKKYKQNENFMTALIGLFNSSRRNTSKIGFSASPAPSSLIVRNVRV